MRRLEYWLKKTSETRPWITYDLVPLTTIPDSFYFDEFVERIKEQGFSFRIVETTEKILDGRG